MLLLDLLIDLDYLIPFSTIKVIIVHVNVWLNLMYQIIATDGNTAT